MTIKFTLLLILFSINHTNTTKFISTSDNIKTSITNSASSSSPNKEFICPLPTPTFYHMTINSDTSSVKNQFINTSSGNIMTPVQLIKSNDINLINKINSAISIIHQALSYYK